MIEDGRSGFLVRTIDAAVGAVANLGRIARSAVRASFERRFTAERMAADYLRLYERAASGVLGYRPAPPLKKLPVSLAS